MYFSTKTYGHEVGLSCCFRQWRAEHSHCSKLHGYALSFKFLFATETPDQNGWVVDFGGLKELKRWLHEMFDHTLLIAGDDPMLESMTDAEWLQVARVKILPHGVGCEAFARLAYFFARDLIEKAYPHAIVVSCEVREHGANSATYMARGEKGE